MQDAAKEGMTMIFTGLGWAIGLLLTAMAAWRLFRIVLVRKHAHTGKRLWRDSFEVPNWYALALWSALAIGWFTVLGVFAPLTGGMLAGICAVITAAGFRVWTPEGRFALRAHLAGAFGDAWNDLSRGGGGQVRGGEPEAVETQAAVAEAVATRAIPSVMEDPALGVAPEPAELVSGQVPSPAPYAALAQFIAGFEPEDDMSLRMFMEGNAAGSVMVADAWHHFADTCLNSVGLDPAYVAGILEAGDSAGGHGSLLAQVHKRFGVIYAAVKDWISAHGPLPHKARDFLTGE
jgi:hypothetical protein